MNRLCTYLICVLAALTISGCKANEKSRSEKTVKINGTLLYSPDKSPLNQAVIRRVSDGKVFSTDECGRFQAEALPGDSLRFSYIGTITKTIPVSANEKSQIIELEPYYLADDEYVVKIESQYPEMETFLKTYVHDKDARIGIGVIINGSDTVSVNGHCEFPMLSVYKFPQAIAVADYCLSHDIGLGDTINISAEELRPDTWSPMRDRYGEKNISLPLADILTYSIKQSDNNACDVLFNLIGGTAFADSLMKALGYNEIHILHTEEEMHEDIYLCYANRSTPLQMAALFDRFYRGDIQKDSPIIEAVGQMMMQCETGKNRIPKPLLPTNAMIGHKTGTGDKNSQGRIIGVNDAGYVFLPNQQRYAIAVFIADSAYSMEETEKMIAEISEIVFRSLSS